MRTRDLIDLVMLIEQGLPGKESMRKALESTFRHRNYPLPFRLNPPPPIWKDAYQKIAKECEVSKKTVDDAFGFVEAYWNSLFPDKS